MTAVILGILTAGVILITSSKSGRGNSKQLIPVRIQKTKRPQ